MKAELICQEWPEVWETREKNFPEREYARTYRGEIFKDQCNWNVKNEGPSITP